MLKMKHRMLKMKEEDRLSQANYNQLGNRERGVSDRHGRQLLGCKLSQET